MTKLHEELKNIVGSAGWTEDPDVLQPHLVEWRGAYEGRTRIMVSPATTREVAAVVAACHASGCNSSNVSRNYCCNQHC